MKNWSKILIAMTLVLAMVLSLAACGSKSDAQQTSEPTPTPAPEVTLDTETPVNIMVLNGTTGFGMAKLISDAAAGEAALNYNISVETDASNVTAALINGTTDIAALPTNAASVVYNKTEGAVQLLALNTRGVLYLVTDGSVTVESFEDLKGQTVYAPAQNPTFIFQYLCEQNGLTVGEDVTIDNAYAQPADLRTAVAAGEVSVAVLPEPMLTMARSGNENLVTAMDLTAEWDKVAPEGSLVQGCVVVRAEFAAEHPNEVAKFLEEYGASIEFLSGDAETVGAVIEESGVFAKGAVAAKALPNCNVCFITGEEMKAAMADFLQIMYETAPASIGGEIPGDDFYYIG
ncbi:MAG: ABC transporter substrate-binding protein [Oscillospiraceae bacterium]|nr:ABC transporter substrate-binding protein [Oscillospiraceae bacterium]